MKWKVEKRCRGIERLYEDSGGGRCVSPLLFQRQPISRIRYPKLRRGCFLSLGAFFVVSVFFKNEVLILPIVRLARIAFPSISCSSPFTPIPWTISKAFGLWFG